MSLEHELNQLRALAVLSKRDYRRRTRRVDTSKVRPRQLRRFWSRLGAYAPLERCVYPPDVIHTGLIEALRREAQDLPRERLPARARLLHFDGLTYFFTDESGTTATRWPRSPASSIEGRRRSRPCWTGGTGSNRSGWRVTRRDVGMKDGQKGRGDRPPGEMRPMRA